LFLLLLAACAVTRLASVVFSPNLLSCDFVKIGPTFPRSRRSILSAEPHLHRSVS
jgi:hypothetical protein